MYSPILYSEKMYSSKKSAWWGVPLISLVTGVLIFLFNLLLDFILARFSNGDLNAEMSALSFWISFAFSLAIFFLAGFLFMRNNHRWDIVKSALIVSIYYLVIIIIEQLTKLPIMSCFYFPVAIYSVFYDLLLRLSGNFNYFWYLPSVLAPFIFVLFGKSKGRSSFYFR